MPARRQYEGTCVACLVDSSTKHKKEKREKKTETIHITHLVYTGVLGKPAAVLCLLYPYLVPCFYFAISLFSSCFFTAWILTFLGRLLVLARSVLPTFVHFFTIYSE